jgi:HAD superfamily hydrolase (TIGR01509 family)
MDGVLFDTIPDARKFFIERHPTVTAEMYNEIHTGNYHAEAVKYSHLQIQDSEEDRDKKLVRYSEIKNKSSLFPGIRELLENLHKAGYILVMNTNAYAKNCLPLLERAGIQSLFDFIPTAEISKDKVEKFKLIEQKYTINKKDTLFITDALGDLRDADTAGVPTIAVTWGVHDKSFFEREKHENLVGAVTTVEELDTFIKNYN